MRLLQPRAQRPHPERYIQSAYTLPLTFPCYLSSALDGWNLDEIDLLFIENVGNLVCLSSYDLGEDLRLVLMSVTEGEDKSLKYPTIFNSVDVAVITKIDLAAAVEFNAVATNRSIQPVRPGTVVFDVSAKSGKGMDELLDFLRSRRAAAHGVAAPKGANAFAASD